MCLVAAIQYVAIGGGDTVSRVFFSTRVAQRVPKSDPAAQLPLAAGHDLEMWTVPKPPCGSSAGHAVRHPLQHSRNDTEARNRTARKDHVNLRTARCQIQVERWTWRAKSELAGAVGLNRVASGRSRSSDPLRNHAVDAQRPGQHAQAALAIEADEFHHGSRLCNTPHDTESGCTEYVEAL